MNHALDSRFRIGEVVPGTEWVVRGVLGRGGFGIVLDVEKPPGIRAAFKVVLAEHAKDPNFHTMFGREVKVLAALDHPNIVRVDDHGLLADGSPYIRMERLEGRSLRMAALEEFERGRGLPRNEIHDMAVHVCEGLERAHTNKPVVVHRDIKLENIYIHDPGFRRSCYKLIDFGIADLAGGTMLPKHAAGTPRYMAPEMLAGGIVGPKADIYSLAVVVYELLTFRFPWDVDVKDAYALQEVKERQSPWPPSRFAAWVPRSVDEALLRALRVNPDERQRSAYVFAQELAELQDPDGLSFLVDGAHTTVPTRETLAVGRGGRPSSGDDSAANLSTDSKRATVRVLREGVPAETKREGVAVASEAKAEPSLETESPSECRVLDSGDLGELLDSGDVSEWVSEAKREEHISGKVVAGVSPVGQRVESLGATPAVRDRPQPPRPRRGADDMRGGEVAARPIGSGWRSPTASERRQDISAPTVGARAAGERTGAPPSEVGAIAQDGLESVAVLSVTAERPGPAGPRSPLGRDRQTPQGRGVVSDRVAGAVLQAGGASVAGPGGTIPRAHASVARELPASGRRFWWVGTAVAFVLVATTAFGFGLMPRARGSLQKSALAAAEGEKPPSLPVSFDAPPSLGSRNVGSELGSPSVPVAPQSPIGGAGAKRDAAGVKVASSRLPGADLDGSRPNLGVAPLPSQRAVAEAVGELGPPAVIASAASAPTRKVAPKKVPIRTRDDGYELMDTVSEPGGAATIASAASSAPTRDPAAKKPPVRTRDDGYDLSRDALGDEFKHSF